MRLTPLRHIPRSGRDSGVFPGKRANPANPAIHIITTAEEIWNSTDGKIDILVAGVGTGGTISGTAKGLKQHNPNIKIIAVEPQNSQVLAGRQPGVHKIQGIGANFVPKNLNLSLIDKVVTVSDENAYKFGRLLAEYEGILAGISSGSALCGAIELAKENKDKKILAILPDTGLRYLSVEGYLK